MEAMKSKYIHIILISMVYVMLFYVAPVLDHKLVIIGIFEVPAPFLFFTFIYPLSDAVTEVYGPRVTWTFISSGFLMAVIFTLMTLAIAILPNPAGEEFKIAQEHYDFLIITMLKCLGLGYAAFFLGMFVNVKLLAKWKIRYKGRYYYARSYGSSCISEAIVTILGQIFIWGSRIPIRDLIHTIVYGYLFLIIITTFWVFIGAIIKNALFLIEGKKSYKFNEEFYNNVKLRSEID